MTVVDHIPASDRNCEYERASLDTLLANRATGVIHSMRTGDPLCTTLCGLEPSLDIAEYTLFTSLSDVEGFDVSWCKSCKRSARAWRRARG